MAVTYTNVRHRYILQVYFKHRPVTRHLRSKVVSLVALPTYLPSLGMVFTGSLCQAHPVQESAYA